MFTDALTYPFRNHGWAALAVGAVLVGAGQLIGKGLIGIVFVSYFFTYFLSVLGSTVTGHDDIPYWPEYDNIFDTYIFPAFRYYAAICISMLPAVLATYWLLRPEGSTPLPLPVLIAAIPAAIGAVLCAVLYLPMAVLGISLWGRVIAVLPHIVLPAIFRAGWRYPLTVVGWLAICIPLLVAQDYSMEIPYGGWLLAGLISFFLLLFSARLLGLFYRKHAEAIAWE